MFFSCFVWGSMVFKDKYCNAVDLFVDAPKTFLLNIYFFSFHFCQNVYLFLSSFLSKLVHIFVDMFVVFFVD